MMLKEASSLRRVSAQLVIHLLTYWQQIWVTSGEGGETRKGKEGKDDNMQAVLTCCAELRGRARGRIKKKGLQHRR